MPYHVEVRRPRRHARLFNLDEAELRRSVLDPWIGGAPLTIGEQRYERRESTLRILEGPELSPTDLSFGQGWNAAERSARDVTAELLRAPGASAVAVLAAGARSWQAAATLLEGLGLEAVEWALLRSRLVAWLAQPAAPPRIDVAAVVIVCGDDAPDWWLFDAGLALGALGPRAVLVAADGHRPPPPLRDLELVRLDVDGAALAERLRRAGCAVRER